MRSQVSLGPFRTAAGSFVVAALREGSTTVGLDGRRSLSFDRAGRLIRAYWGDRSIRRSLENRFVERRRVGRYAWNSLRRDLGPGEVSALIGDVRGELLRVEASLCTTDRGTPADRTAALQRRLQAVLQWDDAALAADGARFRSVYLPVPMLPPDQYGAVVVQATEGCPHNACTFCRFYRDRRYRAKPTGELRSHLRAVRAFFGESLRGRRGVFLADANALILSPERLAGVFDLVLAELPLGPDGLCGIYAFLDAFSGAPKSAGEFRVLAARGLARVYLGLETGCDALLRLLGKPATAGEALAVVRAAKAGGVGVGVIVLLGVGGRVHGETHVRETLSVLNAMGLGAGDLVYLSPLVAEEDSPYRKTERAAGIVSLADDELDAQMRRLQAGIRSGPGGRPKIALYDIRDFVY